MQHKLQNLLHIIIYVRIYIAYSYAMITMEESPERSTCLQTILLHAVSVADAGTHARGAHELYNTTTANPKYAYVHKSVIMMQTNLNTILRASKYDISIVLS